MAAFSGASSDTPFGHSTGSGPRRPHETANFTQPPSLEKGNFRGRNVGQIYLVRGMLGYVVFLFQCVCFFPLGDHEIWPKLRALFSGNPEKPQDWVVDLHQVWSPSRMLCYDPRAIWPKIWGRERDQVGERIVPIHFPQTHPWLWTFWHLPRRGELIAHTFYWGIAWRRMNEGC